MRLFKKSKKKVCVVGLDGVPHSLLEKFISNGTMPVMANLSAQGHLHKMKVTLPEISSVSWTSFMTGSGPGTHGIFGFIDIKPGTMEMKFPSFKDVKIQTFWDRLGKKDKKCIIINQPSTYPARPITGGILISGFVAIELSKSVFPARHIGDLKRMNYELDIETHRARKDSDYLIRSLGTSLEGRRKALELFWDKEDWDYFQLVVTGTDRLQHYLWNAIEDENHQYHGAVINYYKRVDSLIGEIVEKFEKKTGKAGGELFLLSDHGFTKIKKEFNLNTWLEKEGYLSFADGSKPDLNNLSGKAFALDPGRIYFNRKGRFPNGTVDPEDFPSLTKEISEKLLSIECNGDKVVKEVLQCRDIYDGPETPFGPDLNVLTNYGYDVKGALGKSDILMETDLQGMHTWDDAFFWAKDKISDDVNITQLASLIEDVLSD